MNTRNLITRSSTALAALVLGALIAPVLLSAAEEAAVGEEAGPADPLISVAAETTAGNKYLFRGVTYTDDFTLFPAVALGAKGLSISYWGAIDQSGDSDYVESDYGADYTLEPIERLSVTGGYLYYDLPTPDAGGGKTQEVFLSGTYDILLSPTLSWYYDFDDIDGHYLGLGLSHSLAYGESLGRPELALDLSASLGYSIEYTNEGESDFNDILLGAALPVPLNDYAQLTGLLQYSIALAEVEDAGGDDELFFGATVGVSF